MRTRLIFAIVVGLLFCTLTTLEFPELINLTDDTSNDYSLTISQSSSPGVLYNRTSDLNRETRRSARVDEPVVMDRTSARLYDAPELLHLLCTRRT